MTAGFKDYLREAFHARPWGMFVAPNWIGLAAFGLLGLVDPGFWIVGAGLELGYLQMRLRYLAQEAGLSVKPLANLDARPSADVANVVYVVAKYKVEPARLETVGRGWEEPAGKDPEKNRRVEVQWFTVE